MPEEEIVARIGDRSGAGKDVFFKSPCRQERVRLGGCPGGHGRLRHPEAGLRRKKKTACCGEGRDDLAHEESQRAAVVDRMPDDRLSFESERELTPRYSAPHFGELHAESLR